MYVNGVYSAEEQRLIEEYERVNKDSSGWLGDDPTDWSVNPVNIRTADPSLIALVARNHDFKNPLYRDAKYAAASKWGRIIAPPGFLCSVGIGVFHKYVTPPEVGVTLGLHFGYTLEWDDNIYAGDALRIYQAQPTVHDYTPEGEQPYRVMGEREVFHIHNQDKEVARFIVNGRNIIAPPGTPYDGIMRMGFEYTAQAPLIKDKRITQEYVYTDAEIDAIDAFYAGEIRRGRDTRFWEDVEIGEELPPVVYGPVTEWDCIGALATHAEGVANMMEIRSRTPFMCFRDPETNVPHRGIEMHISPRVARIVGHYSHTIVETIIIPLAARLASNWMGDDGMIRRIDWRKLANSMMGDTVFARGRVVRKYVENGRCLVELDTYLETIRGFATNFLNVVVELPSRSMERFGVLPDEPKEAPLCLNPQGIGVGDRFRVKPRADWNMPKGYPLAGETGVVYELPVCADGYIYALMDNDCTGHDPRATVGFRMDLIEKI